MMHPMLPSNLAEEVARHLPEEEVEVVPRLAAVVDLSWHRLLD
jgi:hypothetical protein